MTNDRLPRIVQSVEMTIKCEMEFQDIYSFKQELSFAGNCPYGRCHSLLKENY